MPHLLVLSGVDAGKRFDLTAQVVAVGRHTDNAVHLNDERVSRLHLELRATGSGYKLVDLGSGNGTLVNRQTIAERDLIAGDEIAIGDTVLVYRDGKDDFRTSILRTVPDTAGAQIVANLGVLYEVAAVTSGVLDVDDLLGRVLDLVMTAIGADHGGVLLIDAATGELMPRVTRSRTATAFAFSRTIASYVQRERQGVLIADAAADDRFAGGESIARHRIREVICVPMRGRHDTVGAIFLDAVNHFTADHLDLAVAVAHQAALAVEETTYYRALLDAERLAAVGQTIAGMSHHIKNILQGVRFGGDMIRSGLSEDDRTLISKGWTLVEKNQGRIDSLMQDMLSYSKEREPERVPTDLAKVVADVVEIVRGRANEQGVEIITNVSPGLPTILCDPDAIHAALLNVVSNAIDALDGTPSPRVSITVQVDDAVRITVEDNGPGVLPEQREAIFQPFVSTKGRRGTGLGLAVSRKILREHGGDLTLEGGAGARFVLRLGAVGVTMSPGQAPPHDMQDYTTIR